VNTASRKVSRRCRLAIAIAALSLPVAVTGLQPAHAGETGLSTMCGGVRVHYSKIDTGQLATTCATILCAVTCQGLPLNEIVLK
jgi:type IV secretory pathway VirB2 component (pilin)